MQWLNSNKFNPNQQRYVIDCLKTIGTRAAIQSIADADKKLWDASTDSYAADIVTEILKPKISLSEERPVKDLKSCRPPPVIRLRIIWNIFSSPAVNSVILLQRKLKPFPSSISPNT